MAIDRGPWNALVDDDGSNLVGSIWNKAAIKTVLLDPIDAALLLTNAKGVADAATGTVPNWAPVGFDAQPALISWTGATNTVITGLQAGVTGQRVLVRNVGSAVLAFAQSDVGFAVGTRFSNIVTSAPTPLGVRGFAEFMYNGPGGNWVLLTHNQGSWVTPAFNAADYAAGAPMT